MQGAALKIGRVRAKRGHGNVAGADGQVGRERTIRAVKRGITRRIFLVCHKCRNSRGGAAGNFFGYGSDWLSQHLPLAEMPRAVLTSGRSLCVSAFGRRQLVL